MGTGCIGLKCKFAEHAEHAEKEFKRTPAVGYEFYESQTVSEGFGLVNGQMK